MAIFAILVGILLIILSLKLRKSGKFLGEKADEVKASLAELKSKIQS
jgi:hypothetical protein